MVKAKNETMYVCEQCGGEHTKWSGRCSFCGSWNTLSQIKIKKGKTSQKSNEYNPESLKKISEVSDLKLERIETGIAEFDRVMGGEDKKGIVSGSVTLVAGEPGIGKSTLVLQVLSNLSRKNLNCLYVSGEESQQQIKMRANRLGANSDNVFVFTETDVMLLDDIIAKNKIDVVVVDSIQTVENSNFENSAGSITQIKESTSHLISLAKQNHIPFFIVGHITKEGSIAGPKILEHLVDTVLYFEGERFHTFRILRAVKNRFGAVSEIGVFEMSDSGLREVLNPSEIFLSKTENQPGSAIAVAVEGTRPILLEIQTLITKTSFGYPKRTAGGYDFNRLQIIIATLSRSLNLPLSTLDIYLSVAGGLRIKEPACDLAVALSIVSSYKKKSLHEKTAFFGELGLLGEIRQVSKSSERIKEAEKLGFDHIIVPKGTGIKSSRIQVIEVSDIKSALQKSIVS